MQAYLDPPLLELKTYLGASDPLVIEHAVHLLVFLGVGV
jgi:hypothetical protein